MSQPIRELQPAALWNHFCDINAIPRPSKHEEKISAFIRSFGESLQLETWSDATGNVIIRKPASAGMENREPLVLQSHLDMVHQKNSDSGFDFSSQGIDMYIDGDWVKAHGTTLGADNGIGVAAILSVLASKDIAHPPLEALFTVDEETGMTGALALTGGLLEGRTLLNLDTEDDDELTIGCAGGIDVTATGNYAQQIPANNTAFEIHLKGLTGGHSGVDIHKGRANANKLMNRLLFELSSELGIEICFIDGGSLRNAIPRESKAVVCIAADKSAAFEKKIKAFEAVIRNEYHFTDPGLALSATTAAAPAAVLNHAFQYTLLRSLYSCPNGIYRMSPDIPGLVQSSNNIARVLVMDGTCSIQCLTRSSVDSEKTDLAQAITAAFELTGAVIGFSGAYPGWEPRPDAAIVKLMSDLYTEMFNGPAHVNAIHAGLECGIIGSNYPGMQMISFGPNIYGAHSPDERVQISSVQKFWKYLLEIMKRIPEKA